MKFILVSKIVIKHANASANPSITPALYQPGFVVDCNVVIS